MNIVDARNAVSYCKASEFTSVWRTDDGGEQYEHVPISECTCGFRGHYVAPDGICFPGIGEISNEDDWNKVFNS